MTPCGFVDMYEQLWEACCLLPQCERIRQAPVCQNTWCHMAEDMTLTLAAVRIRNLGIRSDGVTSV
jgi:hypothetical protein